MLILRAWAGSIWTYPGPNLFRSTQACPREKMWASHICQAVHLLLVLKFSAKVKRNGKQIKNNFTALCYLFITLPMVLCFFPRLYSLAQFFNIRSALHVTPKAIIQALGHVLIFLHLSRIGLKKSLFVLFFFLIMIPFKMKAAICSSFSCKEEWVTYIRLCHIGFNKSLFRKKAELILNQEIPHRQCVAILLRTGVQK